LPPVGDLDQLQGANGDQGIFERARSSPRLVVAIAAGVVLLLAWIGWAIYITSSNGATAGLGVVIAWPAMLAALALISLPFIGVYLLIKRLSPSEGDAPSAVAETDTSDDEEDEEDEDDSDEGSGEDDEESDDDSEPEPEAKAAKS
jgi:hypothetical protein